MLWSQRSDAVAAVFVGVNLAAGANETLRQNPQNGSHHALSWQTPQTQMSGDGLSHDRQLFSEFHQSLKLLLFSNSDVIVVIEVLPTSGCVLADCLYCTGSS